MSVILAGCFSKTAKITSMGEGEAPGLPESVDVDGEGGVLTPA